MQDVSDQRMGDVRLSEARSPRLNGNWETALLNPSYDHYESLAVCQFDDQHIYVTVRCLKPIHAITIKDHVLIVVVGDALTMETLRGGDIRFSAVHSSKFRPALLNPFLIEQCCFRQARFQLSKLRRDTSQALVPLHSDGTDIQRIIQSPIQLLVPHPQSGSTYGSPEFFSLFARFVLSRCSEDDFKRDYTYLVRRRVIDHSEHFREYDIGPVFNTLVQHKKLIEFPVYRSRVALEPPQHIYASGELLSQRKGVVGIVFVHGEEDGSSIGLTNPQRDRIIQQFEVVMFVQCYGVNLRYQLHIRGLFSGKVLTIPEAKVTSFVGDPAFLCFLGLLEWSHGGIHLMSSRITHIAGKLLEDIIGLIGRSPAQRHQEFLATALGFRKSWNQTCALCRQEASFRCSGCKSVLYCGTTCQNKDWVNHRVSCHRCSICSAQALYICSICTSAHYCSISCATVGWKTHCLTH